MLLTRIKWGIADSVIFIPQRPCFGLYGYLNRSVRNAMYIVKFIRGTVHGWLVRKGVRVIDYPCLTGAEFLRIAFPNRFVEIR